MLVGDADRVVADERGPAGEQLIDDAAGGVDVGPGVDLFTAGLLRRQILCRPDHRAGLCHRARAAGQRARDAEVHDLDLAGAGQHDVARLDVPVDDPVSVAELKRRADVGADLQRAPRLQRPLGGQHLFERPTVDEFHDDVGQRLAECPALFTGVVDGDDRRVVQRGRVLCLAAETHLERGVAGQVGAQHLDRHFAPEPGVEAVVDLGHAAVSEHFADLVPGPEHTARVHLVSPSVIA